MMKHIHLGQISFIPTVRKKDYINASFFCRKYKMLGRVVAQAYLRVVERGLDNFHHQARPTFLRNIVNILILDHFFLN